MATNMKSLNGYGFDAAALGGKAPEYYIQPRNLLDNSDFTNPVNQRGQTSWNENGYFIDRWSIYSADESKRAVSIDSNGLTVQGDQAVRQIVPAQITPKDSSEYTFALCKSDGTIVTFGSKWRDSNGNLVCAISGGAATYTWAALYEGSYTADTLPPYVPKGYAVELAACNSAPVDLGGGYGGGSLQAYPVGSIYMSVNSTSPASLFGGTWEQLQDSFLLAAGSTYSAGSTGGEAEHTLTANQLPKITGAVVAGAGGVGSSAGGYGAFRDANGAFSVEGVRQYAGNTTDGPWPSGDAYERVNMSFGNNEAHNNMPPYLAVYMWKRVS